MSDNATKADSSSLNSDSNISTELIVAIVAFVISLLAFFTATLQALQQYFASAAGYASCSAPVIGKWSVFTRRRMRWDEFRFEVQFKVPVIFVAPPTNKKGPMGATVENGTDDDRKIHYMDGSKDSIDKTYTLTLAEYDQDRQDRQDKQDRARLRTANNEMATWLDLLMAVQRMESESRTWQQETFFGGDKFLVPPPHTLAVGMQRKIRSWDSMPAGLKKPYATTTISHLIEITAMLGMYWKEFDRSAQLYRAQGNGFSMRGRYIDNLGVVFTFHKAGPTWFKNHRIVPNDSVKELCFGFAPTIFRPPDDRTFLYTDEVRDKKTLQLGSLAEIAETLIVFGCNITTVNYFGRLGTTSRHSHIFSIAFEMLGMLGDVFHIKSTAFRMLPNPTIFPWDRKSFSIRDLLRHYTSVLQDDNDGQTNPMSETLSTVAETATHLEERFIQDDQRRKGTPKQQAEAEAGYSRGTIAALHGALATCTDHLKTAADADADALPSVVESVFRAHLEVVLGFLNDAGGGGGGGGGDGDKDVGGDGGLGSVPKHSEARRASTTTGMPTAQAANGTPVMPLPTLSDLDSASPRERCIMLSTLYVRSVRTKVVKKVGDQLPETERGTINEIWCLLVFRMLFWLLLHDFHRNDVQLPKSDIFGSRVPVYIS